MGGGGGGDNIEKSTYQISGILCCLNPAEL